MSAPVKANRLVHETSPYLRQHARNPVDWYPWGEEALGKARQQDRPILLSVGYSACHWCHVMERESFENQAIACLMNEHFVNIKVDREERPDLDEVYMIAVQAMTGQGGWPMTVFLTPDLRPFYGGTYFPPEDRYGRAGFARVLQAVAQYFREHRDQVEEKAQELMRALEESAAVLTPGEQPDQELLENAFQQLRQRYDSAHGGFGGAPKFPPSMSLCLLLRYHRGHGNPQALEMVEHTLKKMARGGLCDQLGGGFHRYSVDERWLVPHFEKMLYDNALLAWAYLEACQATGDRFYGEVVRRVLDYALREMMRPEGGFCASQDADSEGEEEARIFMRYYQVTPEGNFEHGRSILHVENEMEGLARFLKIDERRLREVVERGQKVLFQARQKRVPPGRDDKLIVAWNGLMISACARAHQVLGEDAYLQAAQKSAGFILEHLVREGNLLHTHKDGRAQLRAYQDDYACLINGLLDLYEADLDRKWLEEAERLNEEMMARFWDEEKGGFFYAEKGAADLIVRTKNPFDNATPSGNSMGALVLLRLAAYRGDEALRQKAAQTLRLFQTLMRRAPSGSAQMLCALDFYLEGAWEIALVGTRAEQRALARALQSHFVPNKVVVGAEPGQGRAELETRWPLLAGKVEEGRGGRAYLCRNFTCSQPLRSAAELGAELGAQSQKEQ